MVLNPRAIIGASCLFSLVSFPALALPDCLPLEGNYELLAEHQENDKTYSYYFGIFEESTDGSFLILEQDSQCTILKTDRNENTLLILDSYLSQDIARQLYFENYESAIQLAGGIESYQQAVEDLAETSIDHPFSYISPSEEWALLQLGVELPEDRVIASVDPNTQNAYRQLDSFDSPAFQAESIRNIRFSSGFIRAEYTKDNTENIVFARTLESGGLEYIYSGPEEEYNPEMISYEHQIPLSVFEGFEE